LLSLHRLDQPCSGVLLFGKTSKAASRVTTLWKKKVVRKEYLCVVQRDRIERLIGASNETSDGWRSLDGSIPSTMKNRSVIIRSMKSSSKLDSDRQVSIDWKMVVDGGDDMFPAFQLLRVRTRDGTRHMVRAILAKVGGCPIEGDVRYNHAAAPLEDQSVALHAFRLSLDPSLKLGSLKTFDFQAPIPNTWGHYFGVFKSSLSNFLKRD